jgi:multidrug efflux pump subunit AcrB
VAGRPGDRSWFSATEAASELRAQPKADAAPRLSVDQIRLLKTRNPQGGMVPLGSVANVQEISGADKITRSNMFTAADLSVIPAPASEPS